MKQITVPRPFGATLRDLLLQKEVTTPMGNPDWAGFAQQLPGVHYETLRKAVTGERHPAPKVIEAVSDALSVAPESFIEYRLWPRGECSIRTRSASMRLRAISRR